MTTNPRDPTTSQAAQLPDHRKTAETARPPESASRDVPVLFQMPLVALTGTEPAATSPPAAVPVATSAAESTTPVTKKDTSTKSPAAIVPASRDTSRGKPGDEKRWLDGHTKLLTICFLIALTATIYFARSRFQSETKPTTVAWQETQPGDATTTVAAAPTAPPVTEPAPVAPPPAAPNPTINSIPPIAANEPPPSAPPVEPAVPPSPPAEGSGAVVAAPPANTNGAPPPATEATDPASGLVVAPANPATSAPTQLGPPAAAPVESPRTAALPARNTSGWQPVEGTAVAPPSSYYPPAATTLPSQYPVAAPAPTNSNSPYPTTDPRQYRYYSPTGGFVPTAPNTQPANTGTGYRHERTGPGLY